MLLFWFLAVIVTSTYATSYVDSPSCSYLSRYRIEVREYVYKENEALSEILYRVNVKGNKICLYGIYGWELHTKSINPHIYDWRKVKAGTRIKIYVPREVAYQFLSPLPERITKKPKAPVVVMKKFAIQKKKKRRKVKKVWVKPRFTKRKKERALKRESRKKSKPYTPFISVYLRAAKSMSTLYFKNSKYYDLIINDHPMNQNGFGFEANYAPLDRDTSFGFSWQKYDLFYEWNYQGASFFRSHFAPTLGALKYETKLLLRDSDGVIEPKKDESEWQPSLGYKLNLVLSASDFEFLGGVNQFYMFSEKSLLSTTPSLALGYYFHKNFLLRVFGEYRIDSYNIKDTDGEASKILIQSTMAGIEFGFNL